MLKRLMRGMTAGFAGQIIVTAGSLLLVPIYLAYWSPERYGEWLALFSLASYVMTLDPGFRQAVINRLAQAYAREDLGDYVRCQHSGLALYLGVAAIGTLLISSTAWFFPGTWLGLRQTPLLEARWVIWFLTLQMLWSIPAGLVTAIYRTNGHFATAQWLANLRQFIGFTLIGLVLIGGGGMRVVAASQWLPLFIVLYAIWDIKRRFPQLLTGVSKARMSVVWELLPPSLSFGFITLALVFSYHGSVVLLAAMLGGSAVAVFATSRTLANVVRQFLANITGALWPELSAIEARGEWEKLRSVHRLFVIGTTGLCIAVASVLWFEGGLVIHVWTRGRLEPDVMLLRLLLVQIVLQAPWMASTTVVKAANRHAKLSGLQLLASLTGLAVAALLIGRMGTWALPVGLVAGEALACYHWAIRDTCRAIGEDYGRFCRGLWLGLGVVGAGSLSVAWVVSEWMPGPYVARWTLEGAASLVATAALTWLVWFRGAERHLVRSRFVRYLPAFPSVLSRRAS